MFVKIFHLSDIFSGLVGLFGFFPSCLPPSTRTVFPSHINVYHSLTLNGVWEKRMALNIGLYQKCVSHTNSLDFIKTFLNTLESNTWKLAYAFLENKCARKIQHCKSLSVCSVGCFKICGIFFCISNMSFRFLCNRKIFF